MLHKPDYWHTRNKRTFRELREAVGNQISGSDIESGYSYVYTWLANQFGHFMIGFAGTILMGWLFVGVVGLFNGADYFWGWPWAGTGVAVGWFVIWVLKEWLLDVASGLRDLHYAERQQQALLGNAPGAGKRPDYTWPRLSDLKDVLATVREQYFTRYQPATPAEQFKYNLVRDSEMDIWCYLAGVLTALAMYLAPELATKWGTPALTAWIPLITLVAVLTGLAYLSQDWLATKWGAPALTGWIPLLTLVAVLGGLTYLSQEWLWANVAFDKSQLPFVSCFVLNARPPEEKIRENALAFATRTEKGSEDNRPGHLVIIGPPKSGRTTTAVALGMEALTETLPPREVVVYTTLAKLLDRVAHDIMEPAPEKRDRWPPETSELLIVDDVGAQGANGALLSPAQFEAELRTNDPLREICDSKRVIWVVGDDPGQSQKWTAAIRTAFTHGSVVPRVLPPIELRAPIPRAERRRSSQKRAIMSAYGT